MRHNDTFYNLIANAPLGIYVVDAQFKLREISAGCQKIFGSVRPLLGRDFAEVLRIIWAEPFASQAIALFRHTLETGDPYHSPDTTEQRGDIMDIESYDWQIQRIALPGGEFGVVCYFFDMTQRVRSQRLLAEQKQLLEMVASNRSLSECLNNLTESVTRLHPAARAGVLIATADRKRVADIYAACFPQDFSATIRSAPVLSGSCGAAIQETRPNTCTDVDHAGGWTPEWRELCLRHGIHAAHSIPIFDSEGNAIASFFLTLGEAREPNEWELRIAEFGAHIASIALDRDRYMNALHENRQRLAGMLGSITDALALLDSGWRLTFLNDAAVARSGRSREELLGRSAWELYPDALGNEAARQMGRAMAERISTRYEMYYPRLGIWVMGSVYPTADGGLAVYSQDITQRKELEEKAQYLAQRLQLITDAMPALISYIDADRRYRFNNKEYQDWFGRKPEEILGKRMEEVLGESACERLRPHIEAVLAGRRVHFEEEIPYKDVGTRSILGEYMPDFQPDGKVAGFYVLVQDITERHRAEQALRESQEQYQTLFESIDEGFCIIQMMFDEHEKPADYRFLQINPAFERETGLSNALGKTIREMVPEHDDHWFENYAQVALTREAMRFESYSQSLQRWFSVFAFPVADPASRQIGLLFSNITERKRAEQAIQYHSAEIETLLDAVPLGVYLLDADFKIRAVNPIAKATFGDIPGLVGRDFEEVMHLLWEKEYADEVVSIFRHTLQSGESYVMPERAEHRLDRNITEYYEWRLNRITLPEGRHGVVCYFRDISQQVEARKEIELSRDALRETDRHKNEFLAMLAHELRNPLTPIRNAAQILQLPLVDDKSRQAASNILERQINQMVRLVDDLLDVSRITRGKIGIRRHRIELATVVNQAVETVRSLCESRNHKLTITLPQQPVFLDADPDRLTQVISNLLNNAYKFTRQGGRIELTAEREAKDAIIRVRDNGIGIAQEQLPLIFEMFTQIDTSLERTQSGLGIGLTLVKNLVEMHGGTVEARSPGVGKGSEFVVRLPVVMEALKPQQQKPSAIKQGTMVPRRILVVDDNRDLTDSLAQLLKMTGHEVHVASDGQEGVAAAAELKPDVILLDIGLPKLNGYEAARKIRAQQKDNHAVLVAVTGWGQEADRRRSAEAGFNAHLVKPVDLGTLTELLTNLDAGLLNDNKGFQAPGAFRH